MFRFHTGLLRQTEDVYEILEIVAAARRSRSSPSRAVATAQTTNGTISGHVADAQGLALPGVTVNATSPNLQGVRTVVTSENGDYILSLLPSGTYTITFELSGFQTVNEDGRARADPDASARRARWVRPPSPKPSTSSAARPTC